MKSSARLPLLFATPSLPPLSSAPLLHPFMLERPTPPLRQATFIDRATIISISNTAQDVLLVAAISRLGRNGLPPGGRGLSHFFSQIAEARQLESSRELQDAAWRPLYPSSSPCTQPAPSLCTQPAPSLHPLHLLHPLHPLHPAHCTLPSQGGLPFTLACLGGLAWGVISFWLIAPRLLPNFWAERALVECGVSTPLQPPATPLQPPATPLQPPATPLQPFATPLQPPATLFCR